MRKSWTRTLRIRTSWIAVLASLPIIAGAALPPNLSLARPAPVSQPADVVQIDFLGRFLEDSGMRRQKPATRHRAPRNNEARSKAPQPPVASNIPVPAEKPANSGDAAAVQEREKQAQNDKGNPAENSTAKQADNQPAKPVAPPDDQARTSKAEANSVKPEASGKPPATAQPEKTDTTAAEKAPAEKPAPESQDSVKPTTPTAAKTDTAETKPPVPAANAGAGAVGAAAVAPTVVQPATASEPAHQAEVPKPLAKPETGPDTGTADAGDDKAGGKDATKLEQARGDETKPEGKQDEETAEKPASPPPPPIVKEDPEKLKACLADLSAIGAKFEPTDPIDEGDGCGIEHPIDVAEVLPGLSLGGATMRCETALTMAHWLKDTVQPALNIAKPGRRITSIVPGSTYACRLRNSAATGKISEHARGNAFDVAAFKFDNGEKMEMKPRDDDHTLEGAFQKTATAGACLHFMTVLAPGSDAAHETHLHLDIMDRKGGYRICE